MKEKVCEKNLTSVTVAILFSFTLLFFIPINLFLNNIMEYSMQLWEITLFAFIVALGGTLVAAAVMKILKDRIHKKASVIFGSLAVLFWLEANFMVWRLGVFDGRTAEWDKLPYYLYLDVLGWIILLAVCLWKVDSIYKILKQTSLVLILTQLAGLGIGIYTSPSQPQATKYNLDYHEHYKFSNKKNVILLVLDGAQTDVFQELLNEDPQYKNEFKNFTYFRDTLSGYGYTNLSMPLFLTGQYYDQSISIENYLQTAYKSSLLALLKQNNFDVGIYPSIKYTVLFDQNVLNNFTPRKPFDNQSLHDLKNLYQTIVPLKTGPYIVKRVLSTGLWSNISVSNTSSPQEEPHIAFMNELKSSIQISGESDVFRYYHLMGIHAPLGLDRNLNHKKMEFNRENFKEHYRGVLKIVDMFLQQLKDKGIYDSSMIIIMADHGSPLGSFNQEAAGLAKDRPNGTWTTKYPEVMGRSHPLLLIKKFDSDQPFKISNAPVSLADIPRTVADELNIQNSLPGESVFKISGDQKRERIYYRGGLQPDYKATPFVQFKVNGNSWLYKSWQEGPTTTPKNGLQASNIIGD